MKRGEKRGCSGATKMESTAVGGEGFGRQGPSSCFSLVAPRSCKDLFFICFQEFVSQLSRLRDIVNNIHLSPALT